jgi:hypothetical protein
MRRTCAERLKLHGDMNFWDFSTMRRSPRFPPADADALLDWCEETRNRRIFVRGKRPAADH